MTKRGAALRILLVEDDRKISAYLAKGLKEAGFNVSQAYDGEEGRSLAFSENFDAAVVDVMLPKLDGLSLIEEMRRAGMNTSVIILSAKHTLEDRVQGLRRGGDDYLVKPFSFAELLARIQALMRRKTGAREATKLEVGDVSLDLLTREVSRAGKAIKLHAREFSLLEYLMRNTGRVVSKNFILENVWGQNIDLDSKVVDVLVCRLRNKVDRDFPKPMIHTLRGAGYVFKKA